MDEKELQLLKQKFIDEQSNIYISMKRELQLYVPEHTLETFENYVFFGISPGDFLKQVLTNNLVESFAKADIKNQQNMLGIVTYMYNQMPASSWRTMENITNWMLQQKEAWEKFKEKYLKDHYGNADGLTPDLVDNELNVN